MRMNWIVRGLVVVLIVGFIWGGLGIGCFADAEAVPRAVYGVLDLSDWDFEKDGIVKLQGEWEFYWERLLGPADFSGDKAPDKTGYITVPQMWDGYEVNGKKLGSDGYATFRLRVKLNENNVRDLGFKVPEAISSYNLWANDDFVSSNGKVGRSKMETIPQYLPNTVFYKESGREIQLILQVANFHGSTGGTWKAISLGNSMQVKREWTINIARNVFLFGCIFIIGFYHFINFLFRKKDISSLFFGLFCLDIAFGTLLTGEKLLIFLFPELDWELACKFEYWTLCTAVPLFMTFSYKIYPEEINKYVVRIFNVATIAFAIFILWPVKVYSQVVEVYFNGIQLVMGIYLAYCMLIAVKRKRQGSVLIISWFVVMFASMAYDILMYSNRLADNRYFTTVGLLVFVLMQALILSMRYSSAFISIDELNHTLEILRNTQDQLVRSGKMSVITRLVSGVAHEINTPLGVGITASSTLEYKTDEMLELLQENKVGKSKLEGYLNDVKEIGAMTLGNLTRAADLIKNFKMLSVELTDEKKQVVRMKECFEEILNSLQPLLMKHRHNIVLNCDEEIEVLSYRGAFFQIVSNLLLNSINHGYEDGKSGNISIALEQKEKNILLTYADDGRGIEKEYHEKIFEPFYTTSRASGRLGLGLNIVYNVVTQTLQGNIRVESDLGQGTKFVIDFPIES